MDFDLTPDQETFQKMIEEQLRDFIMDEIEWEGTRVMLTQDFPLIEGRIIDSVAIIRMIAFIEEEFDIEVEDEEIVPEHFGTIGDIVSFVRAKRGE
jgi:acyl carrier protein